jgi:hypothetical protein
MTMDGRRARGRRYRVEVETGCWIWLGHINSGGYGTTSRQSNGVRRRLKAHRAFYEEARGPIPDGMQLDHLCGNRACVNPDHLEPVSGVENVRRSRVAKLTVAAVAAIKASDEPAAVFAERFGVQRPAIHKIRAGRNWKDVAPNAETRTARPDSHSGRAA